MLTIHNIMQTNYFKQHDFFRLCIQKKCIKNIKKIKIKSEVENLTMLKIPWLFPDFSRSNKIPWQFQVFPDFSRNRHHVYPSCVPLEEIHVFVCVFVVYSCVWERGEKGRKNNNH